MSDVTDEPDFSISPEEAVVAADTRFQFKANLFAEVSWSVDRAPGYEDVLGFIDSDGGVYTAPSDVPDAGAYVVVTAHDRSGQQRAERLVRLVKSVSQWGNEEPGLWISPADALVEAGETMRFKTRNGLEDVSWSLEKAPGCKGVPGVIDADTGAYTAPASASPATNADTDPDTDAYVVIKAVHRPTGDSAQRVVKLVK
ncbi:hypothetical protein [Streptomyces sp. NPDC059072]|uniref:hypothetical protein n=1 Tax=Streptomyces sp. NPDC059072 TaxID=3346715 RepID=UPI00368194E9